jgi:hypothetical protein
VERPYLTDNMVASLDEPRHPLPLALLMERSKKGPGVPLPGPNSHGVRGRETPQPSDQLETAEPRFPQI